MKRTCDVPVVHNQPSCLFQTFSYGSVKLFSSDGILLILIHYMLLFFTLCIYSDSVFTFNLLITYKNAVLDLYKCNSPVIAHAESNVAANAVLGDLKNVIVYVYSQVQVFLKFCFTSHIVPFF